jgi:hypothetical protein
MMHIPLFFEESQRTFRPKDRKRLFALLQDYPHTLSLSAHTHTNQHKFFSHADDWLQNTVHHHYNVGAACGSWWTGMPDESGVPITTMRDGTPNGYALITFKGRDYIIDWKVARAPSDYQMNIHAPAAVSQVKWPREMFFVNVFNGNGRTSVTYRMDQRGEWRPLMKILAPDPYVLKRHFERDVAPHLLPGRRLPYPNQSEHLWSGVLPADLSLGLHLLEVRTIDMWGRTFRGYRTIRVE